MRLLQSSAGLAALIAWATPSEVMASSGGGGDTHTGVIGVNRELKSLSITDGDCTLSVGLVDEELRRVPDDMSKLSAKLPHGFACMEVAVFRSLSRISLEPRSGPTFGEVVCDIPGTAPYSNRFKFAKGGSNDPTGLENENWVCFMVKKARIEVLEIMDRLFETTLPKVAPRESQCAGRIPVKYVSFNRNADVMITDAGHSVMGFEVERVENEWECKHKEAEISSDGDSLAVSVSDGECSLTFQFTDVTDPVLEAITLAKFHGVPLPPWGASACLNLDAQGEQFESGSDWSRNKVVCFAGKIPTMTYTFSDSASPRRFFGARSTHADVRDKVIMAGFGTEAPQRPCRHAAAARTRLIKLLTDWRNGFHAVSIAPIPAKVSVDTRTNEVSVSDGECTITLRLPFRPLLIQKLNAAIEGGGHVEPLWKGSVCLKSDADGTEFRGIERKRPARGYNRNKICEFFGDTMEWLGGLVKFDYPVDGGAFLPTCSQLAAARRKILAGIQLAVPIKVPESTEWLEVEVSEERRRISFLMEENDADCEFSIVNLGPERLAVAKRAALTWPAGESICLDVTTAEDPKPGEIQFRGGVGSCGGSSGSIYITCYPGDSKGSGGVNFVYSSYPRERSRVGKSEEHNRRLCALISSVATNVIGQIDKFISHEFAPPVGQVTGHGAGGPSTST